MIPLADVPQHCLVTRELESEINKAITPCRLAFQILDSSVVTQKRQVFFVRHGESLWNAAQSKMQLHEMGRQTDHPLSAKGRAQAEALSARLARASADGASGGSEQLLFQPGVAFCSSPLTRAIQTAVIALGPTMVKQGDCSGELTLMANAREKQNFGGLDTHSTKVGAQVLQSTLDQLRDVYAGGEDILDTFSQLRFDTQEVQDRWWCEEQAESPERLNQRLEEFLSQLLCFPATVVVVVGHSHFFRSFFQRFLSEEFRVRQPAFAQQLAKSKLNNCGVVRLELDPRSVAMGPIVAAELVLDSELKGDESLLKCCTAPTNTIEQQLVFDDQGAAVTTPGMPGSAIESRNGGSEERFGQPL